MKSPAGLPASAAAAFAFPSRSRMRAHISSHFALKSTSGCVCAPLPVAEGYCPTASFPRRSGARVPPPLRFGHDGYGKARFPQAFLTELLGYNIHDARQISR